MKPLNPSAFFEAAYIPEPNSGCWLWTRALNVDGYGSICIGETSTKNRNGRAHRFSWERYKGEIPEGMRVLHRCDVRSCVNPDHLFLGTDKDNHDDMVAKGRRAHLSGEAKIQAKLTWADVAAIRQSSKSNRILGIEYGVSSSLVSMVRSGRRWRG